MLAVIILAGGNARRFPGKLEREFAGEPLIVRVYRNVRAAGNVVIAANRTFAPSVDAALDCPIVVDRWPGRGPLGALHSAFGAVRERRVFVVSGDLPFVHADVAQELLSHWRDDGDADGVVAVDSANEVQPLCALYARIPFLNAAGEALRMGRSSVKAALDLMRVHSVRVSDDCVLAGVNTPEDLLAVRTFDLGIRARA